MFADSLTEENLQKWDKLFGARAWGQYPCEELIRFVARNFFKVSDRRAVRILEIGCGPGANIWFMAREGYSASAIDGSATAIKQLTARLVRENIVYDPNEFKVGNFANLPWADAMFDAVIDVEALYANRREVVDRALSEVHRVLKPGGLVFSKMFGQRTTGYDVGTQVEPNTSASVQVGACAGTGVAHFFNEAELNEIFSKFQNVTRGWVHRTEPDGTEVFEWVTTATKPA